MLITMFSCHKYKDIEGDIYIGRCRCNLKIYDYFPKEKSYYICPNKICYVKFNLKKMRYEFSL